MPRRGFSRHECETPGPLGLMNQSTLEPTLPLLKMKYCVDFHYQFIYGTRVWSWRHRCYHYSSIAYYSIIGLNYTSDYGGDELLYAGLRATHTPRVVYPFKGQLFYKGESSPRELDKSLDKQ